MNCRIAIYESISFFLKKMRGLPLFYFINHSYHLLSYLTTFSTNSITYDHKVNYEMDENLIVKSNI